MKDEELDALLEEVFAISETASPKLLYTTQQKVEKRQQRHALLQLYSPLILVMVMSILTTCMGGMFVFGLGGSIKLTLTFLGVGLSASQLPLIIGLLGSLYYKESMK